MVFRTLYKLYTASDWNRLTICHITARKTDISKRKRIISRPYENHAHRIPACNLQSIHTPAKRQKKEMTCENEDFPDTPHQICFFLVILRALSLQRMAVKEPARPVEPTKTALYKMEMDKTDTGDSLTFAITGQQKIIDNRHRL